MKNEFITLSFTPLEYQERCTSVSHRTIQYLYVEGYITKEQYDELISSLIVTYVRNTSFLGKIRRLVFGDSKETDVGNIVIGKINLEEYKQ